MNVAGLVRRPTRDVDVLATAEAGPGRLAMREAQLPPDVQQCAAEVAADLGLGRGWLNTGPRRLLAKGLPQGICDRLRREDIGPRLSLYWAGRDDLICLKLLAAIDDLAPRTNVHEADLKALHPSFDELDRAVEWMKTHEEYEQLKVNLRDLLVEMGFNDLAYYL